MSSVLRVVVACVACVAVSQAGSASAVDLVSHQGFEICWATAVTKPAFLTAMRNSIEGTAACISPQSGTVSGATYTACNAPNGCGTGVAGCPVMIHSGTFTGDFMTGAFSAPGTVDNVPIPITYTLSPFPQQSCTLTLSVIVTTYNLDYLMRVDGLDGVFSDDLAAPVATINSYTRTGCDLLGAVPPAAITAAQDAIGAGIEPALRTNTVERSVCPLSSP